MTYASKTRLLLPSSGCLLSFLMIALHSAMGGDDCGSISFNTNDILTNSFITTGWALYKGEEGVTGFPIESFQKIVAVSGSVHKILKSCVELKGHVSITTKDEALEFVRLFTDINTRHSFEDAIYMEIEKSSNINTWCSMPEAVYDEYGLDAPRVLARTNGFQIERYVVDPKADLYFIIEEVTFDGAYKINEIKPVNKSMPIVMPHYM